MSAVACVGLRHARFNLGISAQVGRENISHLHRKGCRDHRRWKKNQNCHSHAKRRSCRSLKLGRANAKIASRFLPIHQKRDHSFCTSEDVGDELSRTCQKRSRAATYARIIEEYDGANFWPDSRRGGALERVGPYEVTGTIFPGGVGGSIFRARKESSGTQVVLKQLSSPASVGQAQTEREKLLNLIRGSGDPSDETVLVHSNIIGMLELLPAWVLPYGGLVMEEAASDVLSLIVHCREDKRSEPLSAAGAKAVIVQLLAGANHLLEHGVSHSDIKPDNLLIFPGGTVKLADFGFVQPATSLSSIKAGTLGYQSPEIWVNRSYYPEKADSWAVGITLFVLLASYFPLDSPKTISPNRGLEARRQLRGENPQFWNVQEKKLQTKRIWHSFTPDVVAFITEALQLAPVRRPGLQQLASMEFCQPTEEESARGYAELADRIRAVELYKQ